MTNSSRNCWWYSGPGGPVVRAMTCFGVIGHLEKTDGLRSLHRPSRSPILIVFGQHSLNDVRICRSWCNADQAEQELLARVPPEFQLYARRASGSGQYSPGLCATLPDVDPPSSERQKALYLLVAILGAGGHVEVQYAGASGCTPGRPALFCRDEVMTTTCQSSAQVAREWLIWARPAIWHRAHRPAPRRRYSSVCRGEDQTR